MRGGPQVCILSRMDAATLIPLLLAYRYWIIFPLAVIEGPMLAFALGILASMGYVSLPIVLGILILGDVLPDTVFYVLGRFGQSSSIIRRFGARFGITDEHFADAQKLWLEHPGKTMLMSKFAYGVAAAFLFMAGVMRMPPLTFYGYSVSISIIHYSIILLTGYFFGTALLQAGDIVRITEFALAGVTLLIALYVFGLWYLKSRFGWQKHEPR